MSREQILDNWLNQILPGKNFKREPLAGDASFRRYYRIVVEDAASVSQPPRFVLMDAPPPEDPFLFKDLASILAAQALSVPKVFASHPEGLLLLSDLGDRLYLNELNAETAPHLYEDALRALIKLHRCKALVPPFDRFFLERQWAIFKEWYLEKYLNVIITKPIEALLTSTLDFLTDIVHSQPQVFIHRDYHSRNLMRLDEANPGILDFQDAMHGPITYDLVSLLQDCYIAWPREWVVAWVKDFKRYAQEDALMASDISEDCFIRWFDLTGVQRHLKNLGIFSRLHLRDGKSQYLNDMNMPFNYIVQACDRYPELNPLKQLLNDLTETKEAMLKKESVNRCGP